MSKTANAPDKQRDDARRGQPAIVWLPTLLIVAALACYSSASSPPNIVLIMADDMGYSDLGCYGGEIRTPNLDRLAARGARFTQFYNAARCCPTRASLMTGLYPHEAGIGHMTGSTRGTRYKGELIAGSVTIAEVLRGAGYRTYMSGKWHLTRHLPSDGADVDKTNWPRQRGFDRYYGTIQGANSFFDPVWVVEDNEARRPPSEGFYYTDAITDAATRFIESHAQSKDGKPLFMYVAYTAPHFPLHAPAEAIARYRGHFDRGWDVLRRERLERMRSMGLIDPRWDLSPRDPLAPAWEEVTNRSWQLRRMEVYAAQLEIMDRGIGRVIEALKSKGLFGNTLILFLADNGGTGEELGDWFTRVIKPPYLPLKTADGRDVIPGNRVGLTPGGPETYQSYGLPWANLSNTPFRLFKRYAHEGGIATPMIAHWPNGIRRDGELVHEPAHLIDIMATCVDLAGASYPTERAGHPVAPMEGISLSPAFGGELLNRREPLYFEHEGHRAVRDGRWKIVAETAQGPWELYDMDADRCETRNLASRYPKRVEQMAASWRAWAERAGALPWPWDRQTPFGAQQR